MTKASPGSTSTEAQAEPACRAIITAANRTAETEAILKTLHRK